MPRAWKGISQSAEACDAVRKEREAFLEAVNGLPDSRSRRTSPRRSSAAPSPGSAALSGLLVLAGAPALLVFGALTYVLATGGNFAGLLLGAGKASWGAAGISRSPSSSCEARRPVLALLARFAGDLWEGMARLGSIIRPEVYAAGLFVALITAAACFLGLRKMLVRGERP